jgi:hypothetical protein
MPGIESCRLPRPSWGETSTRTPGSRGPRRGEPVVTWWLVGDLSEPVDPTQADCVVHPLKLDPGIEVGPGAAGSLVGSAALVVLTVGTRQRVVDRRLWGVVLPLVVVGMFGGHAYRVMTAAVYGANIGAGMVILIAPGVVLLGLGWATATLVVIARSCRHSDDGHRCRA